MLDIFFFYFISISILISAYMVIKVSNPVHSVLFLIVVFIQSAILLIFLETEFLPLMFIIIYVGAIAVLFLFVVMMLDLKIKIEKFKNNSEIFFSGIIEEFLVFLFFKEIYILTSLNFPSLKTLLFCNYYDWFIQFDNKTNIECLGQFLYTYYFFYFLIAGILLLVGMIGAIVLTLNVKNISKNQSISKQVGRSANSAIFITTI
jgi:NADH-quinone oxidoreductase subunit J